MANPWFRMYAEFASDPKVQMLSEQDQRRYIMLLCMRCSNGAVTLHDAEVAFQLRISSEEWAETKATLADKKLIDERSLPTAWNKRQYVSDSSAARVAKHRALRAAEKKQARNVTETPPDTDTDTEEKKKQEPLSPSAPTRRATSLPKDWSPSDEQVAKAKAERPDVDVEMEALKFRDFWIAKGGKEGRKLDWDATWRNWIRNARASRGRPVGGDDWRRVAV